MIETRQRTSELRAAPGRRIIGPAMVYGSTARVMLPDGRMVTKSALQRFVLMRT